MNITRLSHDPITCRWGRRPLRTGGAPEPAREVWLCYQPEHPSGEIIAPSACAACERWEPGMRPPVSAIGWA